MAVRSTLATWFAEANADALEPRLRALVTSVVATQAPPSDLTARVESLEAENAKLKKKLDMAMGAVQASTAQLMAAKRDVEAANQLARQAMQAATRATATAESAAEGVTDLEGRLADAS